MKQYAGKRATTKNEALFQVGKVLRLSCGLTTKQIFARVEGISIDRVRKALRDLKKEGCVTWCAVWHGRNAGYSRLYKWVG